MNMATNLQNKPLVLVVDDYAAAREMYAEYLEFSGFRVAEAKNGAEALDKAFALTPDVILMDLSLPVMDGWEATRRLKADERTRGIPVVALTGHYVPEMVSRGRGAVLNVASLIAFQPVPFQATYGATKAFVLSFTDAIHEELRGTGVTATSVCPGPVRTEFGSQGGFGGADERIPDHLWLEAEKVARDAVNAIADGDRVTVPGPQNQIAALWGQHLPRSILLPLVKRVWPVS